jgi:hypothetical protein
MTAQTYQVTRVTWKVPRLTLASKRKLRGISIPPAPNGGRLTEQQLSDYVDSLRLAVRLTARRRGFGDAAKLCVLGTGGIGGEKVLGEAGIETRRMELYRHAYSCSYPSMTRRRHYPYAYDSDRRPDC